MSNLDKLRISIDNIDKKILELVSKRADCAKKIGTLKKDGVIYKPEREAQIYRKLIEENTGHYPPNRFVQFFHQLFQVVEL